MIILDLFCGIGGAAIGIKKAFPDAKIIGMDINNYSEQYPFEFIQKDITKLTLEEINEINPDFIWSSPPCQAYSFSTRKAVNIEKKEYPDLVKYARDLLLQANKPFIIENVVGSPLIKEKSVLLWADMFNIESKRPRKFEIHGFEIKKLPKRNKLLKNYRLISGGGGWIREGENVERMSLEQAKELFGINTNSMKEASQIVFPQYSEFLLNEYKKNYNL